MKGIIFKSLQAFVDQTFGEALFEEILDASSISSQDPFLGPGTYPDEQLFRLVDALLARTGLELAPALEAFGSFLFGELLEYHPRALDAADDLRGFLHKLDGVIHVEVRKLWPGAVTPHFECSDAPDGCLIVRYDSPRKLCPLLRGLLSGAAAHFDESIECSESDCMLAGAPQCVFKVRFAARLSKAG